MEANLHAAIKMLQAQGHTVRPYIRYGTLWRVLRHADVTVTQRSYIKVEDKIKSAAMKKLQQALSAKLKSRKRDREKGS